MIFTQAVNKMKKKNKGAVANTALASVLCLVMSGCSMMGGDNDKATERMSSPPPNAEQVKQFTPPPSPVDTLRAFAPPAGLKTTRLFDQPLADEDARINRLEQTVQAIKDDFDTVTPAIVRLAAVEKDIKGLISQLENLVEEEEQRQQYPVYAPDTSHMTQGGTVPAVPPMQAYMDGQASALPPVPLNNTQELTKAEPIPKNTQKMQPAPQQVAPQTQSGQAVQPEKEKQPQVQKNIQNTQTPQNLKYTAPKVTVKKLRFGEHVDKTRVVMDLSGKAMYRTRVGDDGQSVVIKIMNADWTASKSWASEFSPLVTSYQVTQDGAEQRLTLQLRYPAKLLTQDVLPPQHGKGYRLMLDLQSPDVHLP